MKLIILAGCLCTLLPFVVYAQKETRNNLYAEGLGITGYYSVNYERFQPVTRNRSILIGADAGFYFISEDKDERWISFPFRLNLCAGAKNFYGEIGVNYMIGKRMDYDYRHNSWYGKYSKRTYWFYHIGVRYQPKKKGLFLRGFLFPIAVNPHNSSLLYHLGNYAYELRERGKKYFLWGGIDVGYSF